MLTAPLILTTYALTFIAMAGRGGVDLSIGPFMGFINVSSIQLYAAGYLHGIINNKSVKESLEKGTELSAKIIQKIGARI